MVGSILEKSWNKNKVNYSRAFHDVEQQYLNGIITNYNTWNYHYYNPETKLFDC